MVVGDHQLHAAQPAVGKAAEEAGPEDLSLRGAGRDAQHLAPPVLVHAHGHYDGAADDPPVLADLEVEPAPAKAGVASSQRQGQRPSMRRSRKAWTRSSMSSQSRLTWLLETPPPPMARTRSSTERVETPWT